MLLRQITMLIAENNFMNSNNAAKFAFYYILSLVALIAMAMSTGTVIFQIINKYIVDVINQYSGIYSDDTMKSAISVIFISAPIYFFITVQLMKNLFSGELDKESPIRKWLGYFIILISSFVVIGWLIGTLNGFLNGELTLKFLLKALTSLVISGAIFGFYFYDIKRTEVKDKKDKVIKVYFWAALAVVVISFVGALFVVETPAQTRERKMDEQVINSLNNVHSYLDRFYTEKGKLPNDLQAVVKEYAIQDKDVANPITKEKFEYKVVDKTHYEVCSVFKASNKKPNDQINYYGQAIWDHDAGKYCFTQKIFENPKASPMEVIK